MNKPFAIIERGTLIPISISEWAGSHSVPILKESQISEYNETLDSGISGYGYDYIVEYSEEINLKYLEMTYCHAHHLPAIITDTERLVIREIGPENLNVYQKIIEEYPSAVSDKTLLGLSRSEFMARHRAYMKYSYRFLGYGIWGIFLKPVSGLKIGNEVFSNLQPDNIPMIGISGLDGTDIPSLSYAVIKEYRGNGYAFEACQAVMEYAKHILELKDIKADVQKSNLPSLKLAEKLRKTYSDILSVHVV